MSSAPRNRHPKFLPDLPAGAVVGADARHVWMRELLTDPAVPYATRVVGLAMAYHVNSRTGWTWTSSYALEAELSMDRRSVRRHLDALTTGDRPYLHRQSSRRGGYTYTALLDVPAQDQPCSCQDQPCSCAVPPDETRRTSAPSSTSSGDDTDQQLGAPARLVESGCAVDAADSETFRHLDETRRTDEQNRAHPEHKLGALTPPVIEVPQGTDITVARPLSEPSAQSAEIASAPRGAAANSAYDLHTLIGRAVDNEELRELWSAHRDAWRDEHTDAVRARLGQLNQESAA